MNYPKKSSLLAALALLATVIPSAQATPDQPLFKTVKNNDHTAEVQVDRSKVTVRLKGTHNHKHPRSVLVTFYDKDDKPTTLELKSLSPPASTDTTVTSYDGTFQDNHIPGEASGSLSPSRQSFVGVELRIPLSKGAPEVLRLKPVD